MCLGANCWMTLLWTRAKLRKVFSASNRRGPRHGFCLSKPLPRRACYHPVQSATGSHSQLPEVARFVLSKGATERLAWAATMPSRFLKQRADSNTTQELPFTGNNVSNADFPQDQSTHSDYSSDTPSRSRPINAPSGISNSIISGSYSQRNPVRSFAHQASHSINGTKYY